jgi:hypothetical protein
MADCEEPDGACLDRIADQLQTDAFVSIELRAGDGGTHVTLSRYARGAGLARRSEGTIAEGDDIDAQAAELAQAAMEGQLSSPPADLSASATDEEVGLEASSEWDHDPRFMRITPKFGAAIPRGDLGVAFSTVLELGFVLPFYLASESPWVSDRCRLVVEGGYTLLSQQDQTIVPGRGLSNLIQNSHVIPVRVGLDYIFPEAWPVRPYLGAAYAALITRTTFDLGWTTEEQNDVASGVVFTLGGEVTVPMAPEVSGVVVVEAQHAEASAQRRLTDIADGSELSARLGVLSFDDDDP